MDKNTFWKIAAGLFWAFYIMFLLSSIPHLADWFRHLDGVMPDPADKIYWALAYGKAVAVDGADVLLTLAFLRRMTNIKGFWDVAKLALIIAFIFGFTGFSWYINWQYEVQFVTSEFARADTLTFLGHGVGSSNPTVGSAFQLFALVFTFISDTLLKNEAPKTAEDLEKEADELEKVATQKQRIATIKREHGATSATAWIDTGAGVFSHLKSKVVKQEVLTPGNVQVQPEEITGTPAVNAQALSQITEGLTDLDTPETTPEVRIAMSDSVIDPDTGEREAIAKSVNKDVPANVTNFPRGDASKRVLKVLGKYPEITSVELAKRAKVSRPYASRIRSRVLSKQSM